MHNVTVSGAVSSFALFFLFYVA